MAKRPKRPTKPQALELPRSEAEVLLAGLVVLGRQLELALDRTPPGQVVRIDLDDLDELGALLGSEDPSPFDDLDDDGLDDVGDLNALFGSLLKSEGFSGPAPGHHPFGLVPLPGPAPKTPAKKAKGKGKAKAGEAPEPGAFPLSLTGPQLQAVLAAADVSPPFKRKFESGEPFTRSELERLYEEVTDASFSAKGAVKGRLSSILGKIDKAFEDGLRAEQAAPRPTLLLYQWKVTLLNTKPPVWRRVQVPDGTLGDLHDVIQASMGWADSHLHAFEVGGTQYGAASSGDFDLDFEDEDSVLLSQLLEGKPKLRIVYEYDFGDGWRHEVRFEKVVEHQPGVVYPTCTDGARACPPEDCGGPWGFADFLDAMASPGSKEGRELKEWYGGPYDPEAFSPAAANAAIRRRF